MTGDTPIRVDAPGALIFIQPKRDGEPDRPTAAERRNGDIRAKVRDEKTGPSGAKTVRSKKDQEHRKIVLTSPKIMDVDLIQPYVGQIRSRRHIDVCSLENGFLAQVLVKGGQAVKKGDVMFEIIRTLDKAKNDDDNAAAKRAEPKRNNAEKLLKQKKSAVSQSEVLQFQAKNARAEAESNATNDTEPFDGIEGSLQMHVGRAIKEGDVITTLSDNSVMWVYFNVPEAQYLEYMASSRQEKADQKIELVLANRNKFPQPGKLGAIEAQFNSENGNVAFRADFENPERLLRHGQRGTIQIHRKLHDATVIPMRATFEILDKRYVYVVDKDDVAHQREIVVQNETDDMFVIKKGVGVGDRIVIDGQVHDGEKVTYEFRAPDEVMRKLKTHGE